MTAVGDGGGGGLGSIGGVCGGIEEALNRERVKLFWGLFIY